MVADAGDVLVPVGESETLRRTVTYAVEQAHEAATASGTSATVHFVFPARWRIFEADRSAATAASSLLERTVAWAEEDLDDLVGDDGDGDGDGDDRPVDFASSVIGTGEYVFSPGDYADVVGEYADANGVERVVVDPSFRPGGSAPILRSFEEELVRRGFDVLEAPVTRRTRRQLPFTDIGFPEFALVFAASALFYLALGGWHVADPYELVTAAVTAGVVTLVLARVALKGDLPRLRFVGATVGRLALYTPILLWEIAKANVALAYVVLHPRLPIDPRIVEFDAAVWGDMPVTTLANSITLTPGTLTIDVARQHFLVHALIPDAEHDLLEGKLERLVRFVFYGRESSRIASPRERIDDGTGTGNGGGGGDP